jgi:hypothetical protein
VPCETDRGDKLPQAVEVRLTRLLGEVADLFRAPRVTLVVRSPQLPGGALVLTDDDLDLAVEAIRRLAARDER